MPTPVFIIVMLCTIFAGAVLAAYCSARGIIMLASGTISLGMVYVVAHFIIKFW